MVAIIIEGPPGSGKGTNAEKLVKEFAFYHLDSGAICRQPKNANKFRRYTDAGERAPCQMVIDAIWESLPETAPEKLVVTGFPRSIHQATWLKDWLAANHYRRSAIILEVGEQELERRIKTRQKTEQRPDDSLEVFRGRMKDYRGGYGPEIRQHLTHEYPQVVRITGVKNERLVFAEVRQFVISEIAAFQLSHPTPEPNQSMILTT